MLWLVMLATLYVVLLLLENARQTRKLTWEKQQMRDIVETTSHLFRRFILVDLEHDTYTILEDEDQSDKEPIPIRGAYSDLRNYWLDRIVDTQAEGYDKERLSIQSIQERLTADVPYLQYEDRIRGDGVRWLQISVLCLKRKRGVPVSVLAAVQDVSELKEREQRSRIALEDAYQSAQAANEAKRTFLFAMSHDMRTPLNAVIGFAGLLDRDAAAPDRVRSYSRKIKASGQHLLALVNEVLDMSKIESGRTQLNLSDFSLSELLEGLTFVFQPQAQEKGQSLKINAVGVPWERLIGDKLRLNEILGNLLSNAIKYTHPGGEVNLTVHGLAMAVLLPHVMREFGASAHKRLAELADVCGIGGENEAEKANAFIRWIEETNKKMGLPDSFDMIREEDIDQMIAWASKEANPLYPVPVVWSKKDFRRFIQSIRR